MELQDFENELLAIMQQSAMINYGGQPNWNAGMVGNQQPQFPQSMIDFQINRAYKRVMADFADTEVGLYTAQFYSVANALYYPIPPPGKPQAMIWNQAPWNVPVWGPASDAPHPPIHLLTNVFYAPQGLQYNLEMEPGIRLIPWKQFQRVTASGYLEAYSYGPQPEVCAVGPDRKTLWFYPGTASAGDVITLDYVPVPTAGTQVPTLVNPTDKPIILPDDIQELILYFAAWKLLPRARDLQGAADYRKLYLDETTRLRAEWLRKGKGDKMQITDATLDRTTSGPYGYLM